MSDESSVSETVGAGRAADERFTWSPAMVLENGVGEAADRAPEPDEPDGRVQPEEVVSERLELDLAAQELAETNDDSPADSPDDQPLARSSDRAVELEGEHWRERAIVWRERAMAAELVAKMLQRNLDDLRANLEDLRLKVEAAAVDAERTAAIASSESPWRRFAREMYGKYLG
jgi:hypothetical protein